MTRYKPWTTFALAVLLAVSAACRPSSDGEATATPPALAVSSVSPAPTATPSKAPGMCGDGVCDEVEQSQPKLCPDDCPTTPTGRCGDGVCDTAEQADPGLCPQDCDPTPTVTATEGPTRVAAPTSTPTVTVTRTIVPPIEVDLSAGQQFWADSGCAECHGAQGEGGSGPALAGTTMSWEEFWARLQTGTLHAERLSMAQLEMYHMWHAYAWLQMLQLQAMEFVEPYAPFDDEPPAEEPVCGDGTCSGAERIDPASCPQDCSEVTPEPGCEPQAYDLFVYGCATTQSTEPKVHVCSQWSACVAVDQTCQIHGSTTGYYMPGSCLFSSSLGLCMYTANCPEFPISFGGEVIDDTLWLKVQAEEAWEHVTAVCFGQSFGFRGIFMQSGYGSATRNGGGYFCKIPVDANAPVPVEGPDAVAGLNFYYNFSVSLLGARAEPTCGTSD